MVLVDERPSLGTGQNLRSAHQLLGRYGERFNRAFQRKLVENISEELGDILPRPQRPSAAVPLSDTGLDGLSLSLIVWTRSSACCSSTASPSASAAGLTPSSNR